MIHEKPIVPITRFFPSYDVYLLTLGELTVSFTNRKRDDEVDDDERSSIRLPSPDAHTLDALCMDARSCV